MLELTIRSGIYFIGERRVVRLADVDRFSVFQTIGDVNELDKNGIAKTKIAVYFIDDNMDIVFSVNSESEIEHGFISIDTEVIKS